MNSSKKKIGPLIAIAVFLLIIAVALIVYVYSLPAEPEEPPPVEEDTVTEQQEPCQHREHHPDDLWCLECGEKIPHDFSTGTCPMCGKKAEQTDYCIDYSLWLDLNDSGTVETVEYETKDYGNGNYRPEKKKMQVYLPYGYSADRKYNVLVLLHGSEGDENYWFSRDQYYTYPDDDMCYSVRINILLDNMIYYKYCEPLIVVSPTYYLNEYERSQGDLSYRDSEQFKK
jgi:Enterochelin esterase and related enzymes